MNEIVKYHNDLNDKIIFPDFKEQELNIFANLLYQFKERETETLTFSADEVSKFFGSAYNAGALGFIMREMAERLRTLGFKWTRTEFDRKREVETVTTAYITMFPTFYVKCEKNPKDTSPEAEKYPIFKSLQVRINPDFQYLLTEINSNFTRFELAEFMSLSGKYTKNLYRLLKQYRQTGWLQMEWKDFKEQLHIPDDYKMCNIDQRILKPAIKELSEPRNLFNQGRVIFENLKYKKIKKGGNKITAIRFEWKKEKVQEGLEAEAMERIAENMKNHIPTSADYNAKQEFENYKGVEIFFYDSNNHPINAEIKDFDNGTNQLICYDKKTKQDFKIPFENLQKANKWITEKLQGIV